MLKWLAKHRRATAVLTAATSFILCLGVLYLWMPQAAAAEAVETAPHWGVFLAAALAVGLACIAAGYAVAQVGAAAIAALAEKPQMLAAVLVIVGLAEGIAIYGLIIAIMIVTRF